MDEMSRAVCPKSSGEGGDRVPFDCHRHQLALIP
jgi:hypothetical protein